MRVVTFNILNGASPADGRVEQDCLHDAVRRLDADVLALQEVDRDQDRSGGVDQTAVAADAMGAADARYVPTLHGTPGHEWVSAEEGARVGPAYGITLLSRYPVSTWRTLRLPQVQGRDEEPRVAVIAEIDAPDGPLTVAATHLTFQPGWNLMQLRALVEHLGRRTHPVLVMGDLNTGPRNARLGSGMHVLARHLTFPAEAPTEQLDHVLADRPLPVRSSDAVELPLSDHRALVVDL